MSTVESAVANTIQAAHFAAKRAAYQTADLPTVLAAFIATHQSTYKTANFPAVLGAFLTASLFVPRTTTARSMHSFSIECRPKHSEGGSPDRDSTHLIAAQKDAGNDTGQPSARR